MINYYNIDQKMNLILSKDKKISSKELDNYFVELVSKSNIKIIENKRISSTQYSYKIECNNKQIELLAILKNITGAGWADKPMVKRVQVKNSLINDAGNISKKNISKLNVIFGFYNYDNNPIFVAWDAYMYYNHKTQRSCYVTVESLLLGYKKEYYEGVDSNQKIWIFKGSRFGDFVESYINYIGGNNLNE